jgi:hypothetical protein
MLLQLYQKNRIHDFKRKFAVMNILEKEKFKYCTMCNGKQFSAEMPA